MSSAKIEKTTEGKWRFIYEFGNEIFNESPDKIMKDVGLDFYNLANMIYEDISYRREDQI